MRFTNMNPFTLAAPFPPEDESLKTPPLGYGIKIKRFKVSLHVTTWSPGATFPAAWPKQQRKPVCEEAPEAQR